MKSQTTRNTTPSFFEGEKWLVLTGLLGFLLSCICAGWVILYGGPVSPNGDVLNAFSFNAALGIFLLSTAAIAPFSGMGPKRRAAFRWSYIILALYSYFAETVQNFRGVNPRFVKGGAPFDVMVGSIFTFVALLLIVGYLFFAVQYFRQRSTKLRPTLVLAIRYAMVAVVISFVAGVWISFNHGRIVGLHGNIIWLHGLGFHALQAVPAVALLAERSNLAEKVRSRPIHLAGITYLLGLVAIAAQTYQGFSILEFSLLPLLALGCFLVSIASGALVLRRSLTHRVVAANRLR
ncbi:hypothetical protein EDM56_07975 [Brevibacillus fluminis]|uniref:Uncharacterized protein n=1 Tax=Brevibacillus fluminis TaxID=511487 RepID=A0A3M8DQN7_9BACL|nr:hypothetical protein [Brevibacillus fluminis]RNB90438.1 hypothetical protein EDM56_07975 [Brevibacillus fluminis]